MADIKIKQKCKDCGAEFEISPGEQRFYAEREWDLPKRCKDCREKRKKEKSNEKNGA